MTRPCSQREGAVRGPADRRAVGRRRVLAHGRELGLELVHHDLGLEVPDLDRERRRRAEPVAVRREDERVDDVAGIEGIQALALVQVPEHGRAIFTTRSAERAVGRDGDGVQVSGVANEVREELARVEVPDLDELVPAARDDEGLEEEGENLTQETHSV